MKNPRIINFISVAPNIGNYTPNMGIRKMLDYTPTTTVSWSKYDSINTKDYDLVLVGGAGLLHKCFEKFWIWLAKQSIPIILWGVGTCWMDKNTSWMKNMEISYVDPKILESMKENIIASNVRDNKTNELYDLNGHVSFCPTAVGLEPFLRQDQLISQVLTEQNVEIEKSILYVHHKGLATKKEKKKIMKFCNTFTSNLFSSTETIHDIINKYLKAKLVVSTRLHGCIIANSLNIPYIAYAKDGKIREFNKMYGGGLYFDDILDVKKAVDANDWGNITISVDRERIKKFGEIANNLIREL